MTRKKPISARRLKTRKLSKKDSDGDGVIDSKDCEPFNPKKQGILHDYSIKRLKRQEEKLESKREKALKQLEDTKDILKGKSAIANKKLDIKKIQQSKKQAIIDEVNAEKRKIQEIKNANIQAKRELEKYTITGKIKRGSRNALEQSEAFLNKKSTQKALKGVSKWLQS